MADSFNELFGLGSHSPDADLDGWWPCQDNAASTEVLDYSGKGRDGTLEGGSNTGDIDTTGPNSWLTHALNLNGTADKVNLGTSASPDSGDLTILWRQNGDEGGKVRPILSNREVSSPYRGILLTEGTGTTGTLGHLRVQLNDDSAQQYLNVTTADIFNAAWHSVGLTVDRATKNVIGYLGGAIQNTRNNAGLDASILSSEDLYFGYDFFSNPSISSYFLGALCDLSIFSRTLTTSEHLEWSSGPELINTVAPALSGTEIVGQTLSATTGTWALDAPFSGGSNGTASYSYQWTRSDDGSGSGEANISGATSSTYTLQEADAGKFIRCFVRATNDGGFDPAADTATAFSGAISGGGNRRRRLLICGART